MELKDMPVVTVEQVHRFREAALKEVVQLAAQVEVMRGALMAEGYDVGICTYRSEKISKALSITPSAALREIEARTLEEAAANIPRYQNEVMFHRVYVQEAIEALHSMAAAKRKGE